jgi:hypothetical protein
VVPRQGVEIGLHLRCGESGLRDRFVEPLRRVPAVQLSLMFDGQVPQRQDVFGGFLEHRRGLRKARPQAVGDRWFRHCVQRGCRRGVLAGTARGGVGTGRGAAS